MYIKYPLTNKTAPYNRHLHLGVPLCQMFPSGCPLHWVSPECCLALDVPIRSFIYHMSHLSAPYMDIRK